MSNIGCECERIVAAAIATVLDRLLATEYPRAAGGTPARLHAAWIDHGWLTRVVQRLAALYRTRGHANIWTCKGWAASVYQDGRGKNVVARGWQVDFRERDGLRFAGQNSDAWKEATQRAFSGQPLQPGSLSLWGDSAAQHDAFAAQITAARLTDKAVSARGIEMYKWGLAPGALDHWLDTTAGTLAAASWYRFWDGADVVASAIPQARASTATPRRSPHPAPRAAPHRRKWRSATPQ